MGQAVMAVHDLSVGKYDLTVSTGPSYTTQRQETAEQMMMLIQAYPAAAPLIGDILVKSLDWKGAEEIAERLKKMLPPQVTGAPAIPPEVQKLIEDGKQKLMELQQENQQLKANTAADMAKIEADKQTKMASLEQDEQIAMADIASKEAIANAEIDSRERIAVRTAAMNARARAAQPAAN